MAIDRIIYKKDGLTLRRAVVSPKFSDQKVLTSDPWTYVSLWLRRNSNNSDAAFYWDQSREFFNASRNLPITASPLPLYYCFLNATKALLSVKSIPHSKYHGVTGNSISSKAGLSGENIKISRSGILPALIRYLGEVEEKNLYDLKSIFENLAFIHRAYCLSYKSNDLFIPLNNCEFVHKVDSSQAWIMAEAEKKYADGRILKTLPSTFERDIGIKDKVIIRRKQRFDWRQGKNNERENLRRLENYHRKLRIDISYISGVGKWYLKRHHSNASIINRHTTTLIFAAMHRLSELCRYDPLRLSKLLDTPRSWLLAEFVQMAPLQFIDELSCEITGQEIHVPGIHRDHLLRAFL